MAPSSAARITKAIGWWLIAAGLVAAIAFLQYHILWPILVKTVNGLTFPPRDSISRAVNWGITSLFVIVSYILITSTTTGKKLLKLFVEANSSIIKSAVKNKETNGEANNPIEATVNGLCGFWQWYFHCGSLEALERICQKISP